MIFCRKAETGFSYALTNGWLRLKTKEHILHLHLLDYTVHTYNNLKAFQVVTGNGVLVNSKATVLGLKEYTLSYSLLAKKLNFENFYSCATKFFL